MKTLFFFLLVVATLPVLAQYDPVITEQNRRIENEKIMRKLDEMSQPTSPQINALDIAEQAMRLEKLQIETKLARQKVEESQRNPEEPTAAAKYTTLLKEYWDLESYAAELEKQNKQFFDILVDASQARAERAWPALKDPSHPIHAEADRIWKVLEQKQDAIISSYDAPWLIYQQAAKNIGLSPAAQPSH